MSTVTLIGNATSDVELRFTQNGKAVGNVTIAVSERKFDRATNEWVDGDTWFARCSIWGELGEHAAATVTKGTRVIATGKIVQRDWEDKAGNKRTSVEVNVDDIAPSLRYATAQVTRTGNGRGTEGQPAAEQGQQGAGARSEVLTSQAGAQSNWSTDRFPEDQPF